jgi:uncharacterized protein (DUF1499 family)
MNLPYLVFQTSVGWFNQYVNEFLLFLTRIRFHIMFENKLISPARITLVRLSQISCFIASILVVGLITIASGWSAIAWASPAQPMAALPGLNGVFAGTPPQNLGIHDGLLAECPASPNCVVSQTADPEHAIAPITYQTDRDTARKALLQVLTVVPRTKVISQTDDYIRFESTSRLMGFVDDGEFYLPADESVIHIRSAARLGESDLGVNRRRLEQIRLAMRDLAV